MDLQLKDLASPRSTTVMAAFFVAATTGSGNHSQASLQLPNGRLEFPWLSVCHSWYHKEVSVPKGTRRNNKLVEVSNYPSFATSIQGLAWNHPQKTPAGFLSNIFIGPRNLWTPKPCGFTWTILPKSLPPNQRPMSLGPALACERLWSIRFFFSIGSKLLPPKTISIKSTFFH